MATISTTRTQTRNAPVSSTERCAGCGGAKPACTCCELTCFERPDYHCGHLLTDADLSLQVRYVVEKNKLRNRTLHGHGVVCGLKLTCDLNCCDTIIVHDGYAIDACGNDIVVCGTTCFDVIAALRAKHLLVKPEERERCDPKDETEERCCPLPQCFYITICYTEEATDFQTPFQAGCASGPLDCVPTRIRERFRLDVTDKLPEDCSWLEEMDHKLRHCFRLFIDSPVGRLISKEIRTLKQIAAGHAVPAISKDTDRNCELFCLLKAQFQQRLKQYPDELSCDLAHKVACLECPDQKDLKNYGEAMKNAFAELFRLMHRYQYDCVLADLVFSCAAPKEGGCIVLGCVEVDDCCVLRVSNTHRGYVWSFANLLQILTTTILTAAIQKPAAKGDEGKPRTNTCCDDFVEFDHETFLGEFEVSAAGRYMAASAPLRAMTEIHRSVADNFAFTDSKSVSPMLFGAADQELASAFARQVGLTMSRGAADTPLSAFNPLQAIMAHSLMRQDDGLRVYPAGDAAVRAVTPDYVTEISPDRTALADTIRMVVQERDRTIERLQSTLSDLQARVVRLETPPEPSSEPPRPAG